MHVVSRNKSLVQTMTEGLWVFQILIIVSIHHDFQLIESWSMVPVIP